MILVRALRRIAPVAAAAALVALLPLSGASGQEGSQTGAFESFALAGTSNVEYALRWSEFLYDQQGLDSGQAPSEALLGRDDVFADSLASGVLQSPVATADGNGRPLLLTPSDSLAPETLAELRRLGVSTVRILGLGEAISDNVVAQLQAEGFETTRLGGPSRIETAIAIAELNLGADTAIVARAFPGDDPTQGFADSLAAGGWAAANTYPVLLTETDRLTPSTAAHIQAQGYNDIIIVGGESAVSSQTEAALTELVGSVTRVSGSNRFETAVEIARNRGFDSAQDVIASGTGVLLVDGQGPDAWADGFAASFASSLGWPIVLANSATDSLPAPTAAWLDGAATSGGFANHLEDVVLICGATAPFSQCQEATDALGVGFPFPLTFTPPGQEGMTDGG